ncbi:2-deoxy-D-gluconate 3-dehydrogenase [Rhodococcus opacus PD630]|uniref:Gluconate dehydrogenase n=1 Tax=Rhodococcus opacus M213 TaxID=1129896 RepID=K8XTD7_RHOOP|nr:SDR family oxidoreductase [Rhodococcus opacus]ELB89152.1 gluconate dehydrogenase [Rhodococcus wratislaviensis IFP 2016]AHK35898.1 Gluconate 5-dehydrogenase [Rhodococcus opacus PD630]EHI43459.1 2-deoxy-D-gluconate 3-dehydrogenase [Rhodococcus opacus PD630]EKT81407.1 gluconate dehydrogenase [Rhodococcus opacus M213]UDH01371.1 SDR family oxidoreductase [Rhodococcus opacus PD630]
MSHPLFDITGRTALVTGSSRGIGRALAEGLAQAGAKVVVNARNADALALVVDQIEQNTGAAVCAAPFDVTDPHAVAAGIARIEETVGPLDICVNNAGMQRRAPFTDFTVADWNALMATNVTSAFLVGREVATRMQPRGRGKIINIASLQSEVSRPGIAPYAATKGAIKMLTRGMCGDLAGSGICVNAIGPGYFETELTSALVADDTFSAWVRGRTPAGRWGKVEDLVGTLLYLSSDASAFVNGQVVYVDGGMLSVL